MAEHKERFRRALDFMKMLGVPHAVVAPVLRRLVKLYDNEWSLIEEENYRALADSYFDQVESQGVKVCTRVTRNSSHRDALSDFSHREALSGDALVEEGTAKTYSNEDNSVARKATYVAMKEAVSAPSDRSAEVCVTGPNAVVPTISRKMARRRVSFSPTSSRISNGSTVYTEDGEEQAQTERSPKRAIVPAQDKAQSGIHNLQLECVRYKVRRLLKKPRLEAPTFPPLTDSKVVPSLASEPSSSTACVKVKEEPVEHSVMLQSAPSFSGLHMVITSTLEPGRQIVPFDRDGKRKLEFVEGRKGLVMEENSLASESCLEQAMVQDKYESLSSIAAMYGDMSDDELAGPSNTSSQVSVKAEPSSPLNNDPLSPDAHNPNDISRGQEKVPITVSNTVSDQKLSPSFYYIKNNITFQDAYVNFSLARIGEDDCCVKCCGNCLQSYPPCHCARETGGDFAYNSDGRLRESLLKEAIADKMDGESSLARNKYCEKGLCVLEIAKDGRKLEACRGHLVRKFIKECWSKCGCDMSCGNRVVQRGICCKLQVFYISKGKGWGLRTLEDLPAGTFICEYVGEILTNTELHTRNIAREGHTDHYPTLLDADLSSEVMLKDEELLCLDATTYGNVARFINHRCYDANMVDVPVEIESPDHHYYHIAFFTTRPVKALEELTWDYSVDFEDLTHPIKAFQCLCKSQYCRGRWYKV